MRLDNQRTEPHFVPKAFKFQWHITEDCNLQCSHCYQGDPDRPEPTTEQLLRAFQQMKALALQWHSENAPFHISITGGEPLKSPHFKTIIRKIADVPSLFSYSVLTNGTLISADHLELFRAFPPRYVQVSIDGSRKTHNRLRGAGSHEKTISGMKSLIRNRTPVSVSFTAGRYNYKEFREVARLGSSIGATVVWADRMLPIGSGSRFSDQVLRPDETEDFFRLMKAEAKRAARNRFKKTRILMNRALQFHKGDGRPYSCKAGIQLLTILQDGTVYPCRRMPEPCGNLYETDLKALYYHHPFLITLRKQRADCNGCETCFYRKLCAGGLKCLSYAMTGSPFRKDPGCFI